MIKALKKRLVFLAFFGLSFLMLGAVTPARSSELSFGFKLSGGIGYLFNGAGDLEKMRQGYEAYATDWVATDYTSTFAWNKVSIIPDIRFEAMLRVGQNFGVALGTGYLWFTSKGTYSLDHDSTYPVWFGTERYYYTDDYTRSYRLTVIPLTLNFYFFVPMNGMNFYGYAGPGIYFGSLNHDYTNASHGNYTDIAVWGQELQQDWTLDFTANEKATQTAFGFQGGLGLEIPVSPNFSFGIEAFGRYVNFNNWKGDWSESSSLELRLYNNYAGGWYSSGSSSWSHSGQGYWYDYDYRGWNGRYYNTMMLDTTAPSGSYVRNVQKAAINLNSIGIMASIIIHF